MTEKQYKYYEEENGEFPFPSIKTDDGKTIVSLYECCDLLNEKDQRIKNLLFDCEIFIKEIRTLENKIQEYEEQNEVLKDTIDGLSGTVAHMIDIGDV